MAERRRAYEVTYSTVAAAQLRWLRRHDAAAASRLNDMVRERLRHQPTTKDTNRKPTQPDADAGWELRVQPYRIYYDVDEDAREVTVIGIAHKPRETATPLPEA